MRGSKIFRKIAIIIPMFFFCLGLDNCKSPVAPEEPEPNYEYRYNVEVIYTRVAVDYPQFQDYVGLHYNLRDPAIKDSHSWETDQGVMEMNKIGENKFRCYFSKVFVQTPLHLDKHKVSVSDFRRSGAIAEKIDIQGAYDQEITKHDFGAFINSFLYFKMSKN